MVPVKVPEVAAVFGMQFLSQISLSLHLLAAVLFRARHLPKYGNGFRGDDQRCREAHGRALTEAFKAGASRDQGRNLPNFLPTRPPA